MIPLADMHVHLLAGLDDGPRTREDAVQMCRAAFEEGVRMVAATAHQNEEYPDVSPDRLRAATQLLMQDLQQKGIDLTVFPNAEVMAHPDMVSSWKAGKLLSVADRQQYMLVEMPHGLYVDLRAIVVQLRELGIRPILAHPERQPELLHDSGLIETLVRLGCLVQVSSGSLTSPRERRDERALQRWLKRGIVHLLGSDGHSVRRRPIKMVEAYRLITRWAGTAIADRVCSTNGMAILQGLPFRVPELPPRSRSWLSRFW
jgi:protein-tyrosine phosphatase